MAYDVLNLDQLTEYVVAVHSNRLPGFRVDRASSNFKRLRSHVLGVADTHAHLDAVLAACDPLRAAGADLTSLATVWKVYRKGATVARGGDAGRVRGTNGTALAVTDILQHIPTGQQYQIGEAGVIPVAGYIDLDIIALTPGSSSRLEAGKVLTFLSPPAGAVAEVELQKALDADGEDEESDNALRERLLAAIAFPAEAGSYDDWSRWALEVVGVSRVFVYPHRQHDLAVDVAAFHQGQGSARYFTLAERNTLLAALQAKAPSSSVVRVLETVADSQGIHVTVSPTEERFSRHWNDSPPLVTLSWTGATRALRFTTNRPADMLPGDVLCWAGASGEGSVIESLSSTDTVILKTAPSTPPPNGTTVYSGGPLTAPVVAAIQAYLAELGPALGDFGRNWDDSIRPTRLNGAAQSVAGVLDAATVTPAAVYTPADFGYPNDAQVPAVQPLFVLVRYQ